MKTLLIENLLQFVEDTLWFARASMSVTVNMGDSEKFPRSLELREALSQNKLPEAERIFTTLLNWTGTWQPLVGEYIANSVADITDWYFNSKRVFSLSTNLVDLLTQTQLPDFNPAETHFIANSFAVNLETPIVLGEHGRLYDFIVCTRDPVAHTLSIRAYPKALQTYKRLSNDEKIKITRDAKRGNERFVKRLERVMDESLDYGAVQGYVINPNGEDGYRLIIERDAPKENREDFLKVLQIMLGINLYLQTQKSPLDSETKESLPMSQTERGPGISSGAEIFSFTTSYALHKRAENDHEGETDKEIRPHFRKRFWRRPKGYGKDPHAKATEWVRPTWVRADRIEKGEIPLAAVHLATVEQG